MYIYYNPNPEEKSVGDCSVRAIAKATNKDWNDAYVEIALEGLSRHDMPSANHVWGAYLKKHGFEKRIIPTECPECYTVIDFCIDFPKGTYVIALSGHVVTVVDGMYYDSWDSGRENPIYYWAKKDS